uniref:NADH-ubiquinone oxidoreductase chain 4 n=1 Tax=Pselaphinae sp. 6 EF-2015 TaxID=1756860 RepID=A0A0S2M8N7_9COLE|nr:NADH deshydrogenase subunit 4 [Pselaphinae sp. 6 EF-2015]
MMKYLIMMILSLPLNFQKNYWMVLNLYFYMFFMFLYNYNYSNIYVSISYWMGSDLISFIMIMLTLWVCGLMGLASVIIYVSKIYCNNFMLLLLLLLISLFCTFSYMNLFLFYLFFEASLIPMLIMIMGWGYQPERLQAGVYLLFYTLFASLPMMISIFYLNYKNMSLLFFNLNLSIFSFMLFMFMNMVFFVKIPMFMLHLWLPKAHVEAPIAGSMILAGIMLKMGGYGMIRVFPLFLSLGNLIHIIFISISMIGGVLISLMCLRQTDMKSLVAYSSVVHMGLVMSGIFTMNYWGVCGSIIMMLAHGLCSSGLFCMVNISYERLLSRSMFLNKGLINLMPMMSLWWFLFNSSNMAAPPSLNLLGEIMLINSLVSWSSMNMLFLSMISFFSAVYSLYLYAYTQHGQMNVGIYAFSMNQVREYLLLMLHWLPLNLFMLKGDFLMIYLYNLM